METIMEMKRGVVIRVGELFLKGKNRFMFEDILERNIRRALVGRDDLTVKRGHGRVFVYGSSDEDVLERLRWVFGLSSYSPVVFCDQNMEAIEKTALALSDDFPAKKGATFRIAARRSDKNFKHISTEIGRIIGSAVAIKTGFGVNLGNPDYFIGVEIGKTDTFLWTENRKGGGGLPVGTSGRATLLLSGGIDSPVAGHLLQKRGLSLTCVYFHAFPYTGDGAKDKVIELAKILAGRQKNLRLYVVPFAKVQEAFRDSADGSYLVLLYRRAMVRIAQKISEKEGLGVLTTGESLGQVASQTLANLATVEEAASMPILRPLICFDKQEIIEIARDIGSYDTSILPHDDCCTLFVPKHPETKGLVRKAKVMEEVCDWQPLVEDAIVNAEIIDL